MACRPNVSYANPRDIGELVEPLRSRIHTLIIDAPNRGLVLISGRRSPWQQWLLRHERCPGRECDPGCQGSPITALPGRSAHQRGEAADLGGTAMMWAHDNARFYGTSAEVVPSENWHHEARGEPLVRIIQWGVPPKPVDPNAGRHWVPFEPGATNASVYAAGGFDNEVTEMQFRLTMMSGRLEEPGMHPGVSDGIYGERSQHAVMEFKVWVIHLQQDLGVPTWDLRINPNVGHKFIGVLRYWTP